MQAIHPYPDDAPYDSEAIVRRIVRMTARNESDAGAPDSKDIPAPDGRMKPSWQTVLTSSTDSTVRQNDSSATWRSFASSGFRHSSDLKGSARA